MSKRSSSLRKRSAAAVLAADAALGVGPSPRASISADGSEFAFIPTGELPKSRRPSHLPRLPKALSDSAEIYVGLGPNSKFSQQRELPPSRNAHLDPLSALLRVPGDSNAPGLGLGDLGCEEGQENDDSDNGGDTNGITMDWKPLVSRDRARREAQHATWRNVVIPTLVEPFMQYTYERSDAGESNVVMCSCVSRYTLNLVLADWDGCSRAIVIVCDCQPAALQLMHRGYFPCAPKRPSIAFSISLLEFISIHSLNVAPNSSAWADTLHMFWNRRNYPVYTSESIRKRLANALHWYQVLVNRKDDRVNSIVNDARSQLGHVQPRPAHSAPPDGQRHAKRAREDDAGGPHIELTDTGSGREQKRRRVTQEPVACVSGLSRSPGVDGDSASREQVDVDQDDADDGQPNQHHERGKRKGKGYNPDGPKQQRRGIDNERAESQDKDEEDTSIHPTAAIVAERARSKGKARGSEGADALPAPREQRSRSKDTPRRSEDEEEQDRKGQEMGEEHGPPRSKGRNIEPRGKVRAAMGQERERPNSKASPLAAGPVHAGEQHDDHRRNGKDKGGGSARAQEQGKPAAAPSVLLQQRCPLCFGGGRPSFEHTEAHVLVCIDANFAQKRRKTDERDSYTEYLGSRFLTQAEVDAMELEVTTKRKAPSTSRTDKAKGKGISDDVLDECEKSFIAAQESIVKASKNYYADTGLMAVLCRHDRVLWVVNMTSAGEKQYYVLALLKRLMCELPDDWNVGVLYDIACQLSRSIEKFSFLEPYASRLSFAVSVFHAYGHQWVCQLVYHPRKRSGFGLSDGEGCERFWSAIRRLIAVLRVCGFFRRLFLLDRQFTFIDQEGMKKFGKWLARRWRDCMRRMQQSQAVLDSCVHDEATLASEWQKQVSSQLIKPKRQSKYAGDREIDRILLDIGRADDLYETVKADEARLRKTAVTLSPGDLEALTMRIDSGRREVKVAKARVKAATSALGAQSAARLQTLRGDAYVCARVNARAVRANIRESVRAHKFERERLERAYRRQVMQNKEHTQTRDLVHKTQTKISAQVRKYNALVKKMEVLVKQGKAPTRRTRAPRRLDAKDLFKLNVDDEIWQEDPGLGPQDEADLPRWQVDDDVRTGIPAMLEVRRCREELERLTWEANALHGWWRAEKELLGRIVLDGVDGAAIQDRVRWMDSLGAIWNRDLAACGFSVDFEVTTVSDALNLLPVHNAWVPRPMSAIVPARAPEGDSEDDVDSVLMSEDDEDEPVAEHLDEVAAAEVDSLDSDGASNGRATPDSVRYRTPDSPPTSPASSPPDSSSKARKVRFAKRSTPVVSKTPTKRRAFDPNAIDISSGSSSSSDAGEDVSTGGEKGRTCAPYWCDGSEVLRFVNRTEWVSGDGIAVLCEFFMREANREEVGIVPSLVLVNVQEFLDARASKNKKLMAYTEKKIAEKLRVANLPRPSDAKKWLVVAHIESPKHWTLVEVCWKARQLKFYDSFSAHDGYALAVKARAFGFLDVCASIYKATFTHSDWTWIPEQRVIRQTNGYDCGPFVIADIVSLLHSDAPSTKKQSQMRKWRAELSQHLRKLPVHPPVADSKDARRAETVKQIAEGVDICDVDTD